jgi:site-specific DNA recombinase
MSVSNGTQSRVAIYLRVSTEDQVEKYGLDMQRDAIDALIKSKGRFEDNTERMVFAGDKYVYIDDGISGTTVISERPQFARLMEDILNAPEGKRPFDAVAVYKIDRFARKLSVLVDLIEFFENQGIQMLSANESIDTSTAFGRAVLGIIGVIAELEIETFKQRSADGRKAAIRKGVFMGEVPPYGYIKTPEKTLRILEEEAIVVREIFDMFLKQFMSPQQIADDLTKRKILSPSSSAIQYRKKSGSSRKKNADTFWSPLVIRKILFNEIYIGTYYYGKTKKGKRLPKSEWKKSDYRYPSIIEKADFSLVQQRLKKSKSRSVTAQRKQEDKHIYLLSGLLRCEACLDQQRSREMPHWVGEPRKMIVSGESVTARYYKCGRRNTKKYSGNYCNVITLPGDQIEQIIFDQVKELLKNPDAVINYQNKLKSRTQELKQLKTKRDFYEKLINAAPDKIERLKEQHQAGIISSLDELKQKIAEQEGAEKINQDKLFELETQIGKIVLSDNYVQTFKHFQDKYIKAMTNIEENRHLLKEVLDVLLDKVVVKSRPVTPEDTISGRKKEGQYIPYKLDLHFRLPKDMLHEAFFKFGVKDANL